MFYQPCLRAKEFRRETILVLLFIKIFHSTPLKSSPCCEISSRITDSVDYAEKHQRKRHIPSTNTLKRHVSNKVLIKTESFLPRKSPRGNNI